MIVTDKLGKPPDEGIERACVILNQSGIKTIASCEGHVGWGTGAFYVDIDIQSVARTVELFMEWGGCHNLVLSVHDDRARLESRDSVSIGRRGWERCSVIFHSTPEEIALRLADLTEFVDWIEKR